MKRETIYRIRKTYLVSSILIGLFSPLICLILFPEFDPRIHPVSYFGILKNTSTLFMTLLIMLSISLFFNGERAIHRLIKNRTYKIWLKTILIISSTLLLFTGLITMNISPVHQIIALLFFLSYNFFIFLFGLARSTSYVRKGMFSVITGSLMLLSSLLLIPFPSYGVAEVIYIVLVFFWNIVIFIQSEKINKN